MVSLGRSGRFASVLVLVIIACRCYLHCGPFEWKVLACLLMNIKVMTLKHTHKRGSNEDFQRYAK